MKSISKTPTHTPIHWTRADPDKLAAFNPATKYCTMNCGAHTQDPRTAKERKYLCDDCTVLK